MGLGFSIAALLMTFVLASVALAIGGWFQRWRQRIREPGCGRCFYPVKGLPGLTCPECGADLREAGILTVGMRKQTRTTLGEVVGAWNIGMVVVGMVATGAIGSSPLGRADRFWRNYFVKPVSGAYTLSVTASGRQRSMADPARSVEVVIDGSPGELSIRLDRATWQVRDGRGVASKGVGQPPVEVVAAWFNAAGIDTSIEWVQTEIAGLDAMTGRLAAANTNPGVIGPFTVSSTGMTSTSGPSPTFVAGSAAFWGLAWLVGLVCIVRRRRGPQLTPTAR